MRKYTIYISILVLPGTLLGCSITSQGRVKDIDRKVNELSLINQSLEKRVDDLSKSISLLISDGNRLHNAIDDTHVDNKNIRQDIKEIESLLKGISEHIEKLEAGSKIMEEDFTKRINNFQKAEIELSNRLEMLKLDMKAEIKMTGESPTNP